LNQEVIQMDIWKEKKKEAKEAIFNYNLRVSL